MSVKISGSKYAAMYGPTVGDKVRLADTSLVIEVEKDYTTYGDEVKFGGGKSIRDGMGQSVKTCSRDGDLDLVITNALIVDATGIVKADIGIKDGKIAGIGKAGNPDVMDGVTPVLLFRERQTSADSRPAVSSGSKRWRLPFSKRRSYRL